jgi:hypothetical protein
MEQNCANAVCWVTTPSELGIPEISAPSHHSLREKKRQIFQEHSSSSILPYYTNKFCSKIPTERKGHQKFNNMKKLASNQGDLSSHFESQKWFSKHWNPSLVWASALSD